MILIADSGSTTTEWLLLQAQTVIGSVRSEGLNPVVLTEVVISERLAKAFPDVSENQQIQKVYFFGAGCWNKDTCTKMQEQLELIFSTAHVLVDSDLLGAIKATCGTKEGITCILGTGTNTAAFDGQQIIDTIPSLGYILGDEGSGSNMGKKLLQHFFYRELPPFLHQKFVEAYNLEKGQVIEKIYRQVGGNRYLAAFTPFLSEHLTHPFIRNLVKTSFEEFLERHVLKYKQCKEYPIHFVGSIAYHFKHVLIECLAEQHLQLGKIIQRPIEALGQHYCNKQ